jgi:hypothetical protein
VIAAKVSSAVWSTVKVVAKFRSPMADNLLAPTDGPLRSGLVLA